jgi:nucleoside-diphosphate-sugar epimerase
MPQKLMDSSKMRAMGLASKVPLRQGLVETYRWFLANYEQLRR